MNQPWFRFYHEALDDPKVQTLPPDLFKFWVNLLCLASRNKGFIGDISSVSFAFRCEQKYVETSLQTLHEVGLLDRRFGKYTPHNWFKRQYKSDVSTERVKRFRKRFETVSRNGVKRPSEQIQNRTETEQNRKGDREASGAFHAPVPIGEFHSVVLQDDQVAKLQAKLNGNFQRYVDRLDRYSQTHPKEFAKYKSHYAVLQSWFDRDVAEGKIKPEGSGHYTKEQIAEATERMRKGGVRI